MQTEINLQEISSWANNILKSGDLRIVMLNGDASFRTYYRATNKTNSYILMDSKNDPSLERYVEMYNALKKCDVSVPKIIAKDFDKRYLLLEDFGDDLYLNNLSNNTDKLYKDAISSLIRMQANFDYKNNSLPKFELKFIKDQLSVFSEWYVTKHLGLEFEQHENKLMDDIALWFYNYFEKLPQSFVHKDYHSRNLMLIKNNNPGILDFQDAMLGPNVYDLVSLFQDAYISWNKSRVYNWLTEYNNLVKGSYLEYKSIEDLTNSFYVVGLQRHIKNLGIFARLCHRDNKPEYLKHIPQLLKYIFNTCQSVQEPIISEFGAMLSKFVAGNTNYDIYIVSKNSL